MRTKSRLALAFWISLGITLAQQPAPPPAGGGGGGGGGAGAGGAGGAGTIGTTSGRGTPGVPSRGTDPFGGIDRQQQRPVEQRPIFLSGKVILEDGTAPPEPVTIERVCNGQVRPEAYTDSKGRFSFQLGAQNNVLMDASVSSSAGSGFGRDPLAGGMGGTGAMGGAGASPNSMGMVDLMGCELRASLPGFRSEAVMLNRRSMFDNPDVGTIILHRLSNVAGTAISFTTLNAPKDARKSFDKAQSLLKQKSPKHAEVAKELEKAVQIYPQFAAAWNMLGDARLALKDEEGARKAFEQSLAADGKYVNPYVQLAVLDLRASKWADAAEITGRLAQLNPYSGQAHYFNAIANYNLGKMDLAEKAARNAAKSDEQNRYPMVHHLLGAILARQGNFPSAAEEFRSFLKISPTAPAAEQIRKQLTEWEGLGVIQRAETAVK
ncbi:MAG: tetratricopeptide repeat protein [Acidobacteria bacterium]|nr:tetratricopeptide repeat protein [Acidobacteriota bacterium]